MSFLVFPPEVRAKGHLSRGKDLVIVAWEAISRGMPPHHSLDCLAKAIVAIEGAQKAFEDIEQANPARRRLRK